MQAITTSLILGTPIINATKVFNHSCLQPNILPASNNTLTSNNTLNSTALSIYKPHFNYNPDKVIHVNFLNRSNSFAAFFEKTTADSYYQQESTQANSSDYQPAINSFIQTTIDDYNQITTLNKTQSSLTTDLIAHYSFDNGSAEDVTGNGHNATLVNGVVTSLILMVLAIERWLLIVLLVLISRVMRLIFQLMSVLSHYGFI